MSSPNVPQPQPSVALSRPPGLRVVALVALLALGAGPLAPPSAAQLGTLTTVDGRVHDLSVHSSGDLLYCTAGRDVGRITTAGVVTIVANAASGPFDKSLSGVVETPGGDIAVVDVGGDVHVLAGGVAPATEVYTDLYMIQGATDLVVDATGNWVIASDTPSTGFRAVNWVSADGVRWSYYLVEHTPVAIAADPVTGDILMADESAGGALRLIDTNDKSHPTSLLDNPGLGLTEAGHDGDMAVETDGSVWTIAGGAVYRYDRGLDTTFTVATGLAQLRGIAIAASSGGVPSASGWSVYLAEGATPTTIREIGNVGAPASVLLPALGTVPDRGVQKHFFQGFNCYEMAVDLDGNLLVGGDNFGSGFRVARINLPAVTQTTVALQSDGLTGRIEGIQVAPDGSIYVLTKQGRIQRIVENPLSVTTVFSDPGNDIVTGKDMIRERDGTFYVADRFDWGIGQVERIDPSGLLTTLAGTVESRGLMADPFTARPVVTEWNDAGFHGTVGRIDPQSGAITDLVGFEGMNYTNADSWGDGDIAMDVRGNVYTVSEDDWSVYRYNTITQKKVRVGSSYQHHPSGVAIARSTIPNASGWSLYVAEFNWLWEIPDVAPPAPTRLDTQAPPIGRLVGWLPGTAGRPRAMFADQANARFFVTTDASRIYEIELTSHVTKLLDANDGLFGDLVAIASPGAGTLYVANRAGTIFEVDAGLSVSVWFSDPLEELADVRGLEIDGNGDVLVLDRPPGSPAGRLYRISGGTAELLAFTNRGVRMAIDPLTADVFVTQEGTPSDGGGEVLRVDTFASPASAGHYRGDGFHLFDVGSLDGDIGFDASGNFYVVTGRDGRVVSVDRATGAFTPVAGNYMDPVAVSLAPGRAGTAGPMGTSLFVLDDVALYEVGVGDLPAPAPPAVQPGLAPPAELRVHGLVTPGVKVPITLESPAHAGQAFAILPTFLGKVPGFPLQILGDPDPRVIPNNFSFLWFKLNSGVFPGHFALLDGAGLSPPNTGFRLPNDPSLLGLELFFDLAWIAYDPASPNGIEEVGSTAQLYVGQ